MSDELDKACTDFKEKIEPYGRSWQIGQVKLMGAMHENTWRVLGLRAGLSYEEGFGLDIPFEDPKLIMINDSFAIASFEAFLDGLKSGFVTVAQREFQVVGFTNCYCTEKERHLMDHLAENSPTCCCLSTESRFVTWRSKAISTVFCSGGVWATSIVHQSSSWALRW